MSRSRWTSSRPGRATPRNHFAPCCTARWARPGGSATRTNAGGCWTAPIPSATRTTRTPGDSAPTWRRCWVISRRLWKLVTRWWNCRCTCWTACWTRRARHTCDRPCTTCWHIGRWPCSPTRRPDWRNRRHVSNWTRRRTSPCSSPLPIPGSSIRTPPPGCSRPCACTAIWPGSTCQTPGPTRSWTWSCNDWPSCVNTVCCLTRTACTWTR